MSDTKITETFEYKTDIVTAYDGHEQRLKLRQSPRHKVSYDYEAMDEYQSQWLRGMLRKRSTDLYYIPMWHQPVYLSNDMVANNTILDIDKEYMYNLDECEYIEIFAKDDVNQSGINMVRKIALCTDGRIAVTKTIKKALNKKNTFIYPLKKMITQKDSSSVSYIFSNGTETTLNFEEYPVESIIHIPNNYRTEYQYDKIRNYNVFNLPEKFNDKYVLLNSPQWIDNDSVELSVEKNLNLLDNETGKFYYDLKNTYSYDIHTITFLLDCQQRINNMKKFFSRVCGKYKSFYAPTWANDFEVIDDGSFTYNQNFLYTSFNKLSKFYLSNKRRKFIVVFTKWLTSFIYEIMAYTTTNVGDEETKVEVGKIILDTQLDPSINGNILMVSYLNLVRLDDDELKLDYESNIVATTTLVMREVDDIQ